MSSTHKPAPSETFARLLRAAQEDAAFRRQVLTLLRSSPLQRQSVVNTALHEMALRGEPADVRAAFALLASDESAKLARELLGSS